MSDPFMDSVKKRIAERAAKRKKLFLQLSSEPAGFRIIKVQQVMKKPSPLGFIPVRHTHSIQRKPTRDENFNNKEMLMNKHGLKLGW